MTVRKVFWGLLVFTLTFVVVSNYIDSQPKVAKYEILDKPSYGDQLLDWIYGTKNNKEHPIIHIVKKNGTYGNCTAFVVSDTAALTAGHCIDFSKEDLKAKEAILKDADINIKLLEKSIATIRLFCPSQNPECQVKYSQATQLLQLALKAREQLKKQQPDKFKVYNINGDDTGVEAVAYSKGSRRDYGWLEGDFKKFNKLHIRSNWHVKPGDTLRACGFYGSKLPPSCTDFIAIGNYGFDYAGRGVLLPGVSGGPVIDHLGYAVGIAVSANNNFVLMTPTLGLIDILTKEQVDKREKQSNSNSGRDK